MISEPDIRLAFVLNLDNRFQCNEEHFMVYRSGSGIKYKHRGKGAYPKLGTNTLQLLYFSNTFNII